MLRQTSEHAKRQQDALMRTSRATADDAKVKREFQVPRFLWRFADVYQGARRAQRLDGVFWDGLGQVLQDYNQRHPTGHRAPIPGVPPPVQPTTPIIPPPQVQFRVMMPTRPPIAGPSRPRPTPPSDSEESARRSATPAPAPSPMPVSPPLSRVPVPGVRIPGQPVPARFPKKIVRPRVPVPMPQTPTPPAPAVPVPGVRIPGRTFQPAPASLPSIIVRPRVPVPMPQTPTAPAQNLGVAGPSRDWQLSPLMESSNESARLPAGGKRDKGKARMRDERPEEQGDSRGMQQERRPESKKRRPPQSTGQLRENTCRRCERLHLYCISQAGGKACVSCARVKMKCVDFGDDGHATDVTRPRAP
ncbi:hypothetical protein BYT27DRAFT_7254407 [Phlegmacium glaucopus]|nr:hypothetical protein BYT27DRAFT_7254407 [Phlegmacium glaucopus]